MIPGWKVGKREKAVEICNRRQLVAVNDNHRPRQRVLLIVKDAAFKLSVFRTVSRHNGQT